MGIFSKIKRKLNKETEPKFLVKYTLWVDDPIKGYYSYEKSMLVPISIVDENSYRMTEKLVSEYISSHVNGDVAVYDLYNNNYIKSIFIVDSRLNKLCLLKQRERLVDNIKPR